MEEIDFKDLIYNTDDYLADSIGITRVRLEVVTDDGNVFYIHRWDYGCQQIRLRKVPETLATLP
jgi:hypothetical protein